MKKILQFFILGILTASMSGCASFASRGFADIGRPSRYYPGPTLIVTEWIPSCFQKGKQPRGILLDLPLSIIDLPLSFTADTICLPCDIFNHIQEKRIEPENAHLPKKAGFLQENQSN
jgi:uncharacterized protein YceK